ncbi:MAG: Gfo/Idh/MocA family oxidoreductase, partial [Phycisphaerales bacterium]
MRRLLASSSLSALLLLGAAVPVFTATRAPGQTLDLDGVPDGPELPAANGALEFAAELDKKGTKVAKFTDFRKVCESKDIDAVVIATPNHTHALIGATAAA